MDNVENEGLDLDEKQVVTTVLKRGITLELSLQISLVVLELALFDSLGAVLAEVDHLGEAADLGGHIGNVEATLRLLTVVEQVAQSGSHHLFKLVEPVFDFTFDRNWLSQCDVLVSRRYHRLDLRVFLVKGYFENTAEQLFQMALDNVWIAGLTKDLKQIIISNEVESREFLALLLEEVIERLLAHLKLGQNSLEALLEAWNLTKTHHFGVCAKSKCNGSVLFVDAAEPTLLRGEGTSHEDGLKVDPLALNDVQLGKMVINSTKSAFELLDRICKALEES